jgi:hypothetical protein
VEPGVFKAHGVLVAPPIEGVEVLANEVELDSRTKARVGFAFDI